MTFRLDRENAETIACPDCGAHGLRNALGNPAYLHCSECGADHHYRQFMRDGWALEHPMGHEDPVLRVPEVESQD